MHTHNGFNNTRMYSIRSNCIYQFSFHFTSHVRNFVYIKRWFIYIKSENRSKKMHHAETLLQMRVKKKIFFSARDLVSRKKFARLKYRVKKKNSRILYIRIDFLFYLVL